VGVDRPASPPSAPSVGFSVCCTSSVDAQTSFPRAGRELQHAVKCLHSRFAPQGVPRREEDYWLDVAELAAD
jgi:hypothetical protein